MPTPRPGRAAIAPNQWPDPSSLPAGGHLHAGIELSKVPCGNLNHVQVGWVDVNIALDLAPGKAHARKLLQHLIEDAAAIGRRVRWIPAAELGVIPLDDVVTDGNDFGGFNRRVYDRYDGNLKAAAKARDCASPQPVVALHSKLFDAAGVFDNGWGFWDRRHIDVARQAQHARVVLAVLLSQLH